MMPDYSCKQMNDKRWNYLYLAAALAVGSHASDLVL
jgi:hypothetical protein